jgi:GNAT superfamily N-acetyltransferase
LAKVETVDLRKHESFIPQYVDLRNTYKDLLLTTPVTITETKEWLLNKDVEVRCLVKNNILIGAAILYLNKKGEIAFFVKEQKGGIGSQLLDIIEKVARERSLDSVWAWVLSSNVDAQKVFIKNGFFLEKEGKKKYNNKTLKGIVFRKMV